MHSSLQSSVVALCVFAAAGCVISENSSLSVSSGRTDLAPAVRLSFKSRMITNQSCVCIYRNGRITDDRYGERVLHEINRAAVKRLIQRLEQAGFSTLDQKNMASAVERADTSWQGTSARHSLVMVDATTTTLSAVMPSGTNTISVTGLSSHLKEYPDVAEFHIFKSCVDIVESAVPAK